jgi:hypothetical protein
MFYLPSDTFTPLRTSKYSIYFSRFEIYIRDSALRAHTPLLRLKYPSDFLRPTSSTVFSLLMFLDLDRPQSTIHRTFPLTSEQISDLKHLLSAISSPEILSADLSHSILRDCQRTWSLTNSSDPPTNLLISNSCSPRSASPTILSADFLYPTLLYPQLAGASCAGPLCAGPAPLCVNPSSPPFFPAESRRLRYLPSCYNVLSSENPGADPRLHRPRSRPRVES